ncbi:transcriptional regulator [Dermabacteraceae bacterium TAE3-ERU27]|nr:transcriptional regulator [Dermabacteraceae bacterium TAE3-ERU27]
MTEQRIRFRDIKPYDCVDSLDELRGPGAGVVTLPVTVYWSGASSTFDLSKERERASVYQAALANGTRERIAEFVNRDLLIKDWPRLALDRRVVEMWEGKFPELAARGREF